MNLSSLSGRRKGSKTDTIANGLLFKKYFLFWAKIRPTHKSIAKASQETHWMTSIARFELGERSSIKAGSE
jgi:hypothetical protein